MVVLVVFMGAWGVVSLTDRFIVRWASSEGEPPLGLTIRDNSVR